MSLLRQIVGMILLLLLPLGVMAQCSSVAEKELTVAERNAAQGFNDTIDRLAEDFIEAYLVVVDPSGEAMYSVLGHSCLHLKCDAFGLDNYYSYVSEDIEGKVLRFLINDLRMGLVELTSEELVQEYAQEGRGVREFRLNLPPEVEMELWRICDQRVSQGLGLKYDYMSRGCAIAIVHSVENAVNVTNRQYGTNYEIEYATWGKEFDRTLREIGYDFTPEGWLRFMGMTIIGGKADYTNLPNTEKLTLPSLLAATWQKATIAGQPLLETKEIELLPSVKVYEGDRFTPLHFSIILLLLAIGSLFWKRSYIDWLLLAIQTGFGCFILWLLISPLPGSEWNWLIIPFNPLPAFFWKWREKWAIPYATFMFAWCIGMMCAPHRLVEYAHIVFVIAFILTIMKTKIRNLIFNINEKV